MTRNSRLACFIVAGLCSGTMVQAQQTFGAFKGRVTDKVTGAPKAGVLITIENQATGYHRQVVSNNDGTFRFSVVPLGNYRILFKSSDSTASMIRTSMLGAETDASATMAPAATATVTVVATADTVDQANTTSAEVGVNVSSERLESLPVLSRNVVSAAVLAPGVQLIAGSNVDPTKKSSTYMSTGEGSGRGTNFNIDGGDNNSTDVGGYVSPIPMDAIGEFQVVTNQYKAEFGRSNAGFMNVVSKAGSNTFSGIVSGQFTNQAMRAMVTDEHIKKDNKSTTLAALVSGPIIKDKLFYMASVERKDEEGAAYTFTPAAIAAYPELGSIKTQVKENVAYMRMDWAASQSVNATLTYSYDKNETPNQSFSHVAAANGNVSPSMLGTGLNKTNRYGAKVTTSFNPNLIWESNVVYFDYANQIRPNAPSGPGEAMVEVRTRNGDWTPIKSSERARVGIDWNSYQNTGIKRLQWRNDLTYMTGDHFIKAGLDFQKSTYAESVNFGWESGAYTYYVAGTQAVPISFGPMLLGPTITSNNVIAMFFNQNGTTPGDSFKQYGFYAQDDWTISPKLSIYLGIRADKDTVYDSMKPFEGLYAEIYAANPNLLHGSSVPTNKTYISPRLQVIYKPKGDDSVTFKLGYGRFVANTIDNITGFSRKLGAKTVGLTGNIIGNDAGFAATGAGDPGSSTTVANFNAGTVLTTVNGHSLILPADLTPYNYINNVNGLHDYFRHTVEGWTSAASFGSAGKSLLASDFEYPTTDTVNLGGTFKLDEHQTVDIQYIWSRTRNASAQWTTDGSDIRAWSPSAKGLTYDPTTAPGLDQGDSIFTSNQSAQSHQLQVKYAYTTQKFSALFNIVAKAVRSTYGGATGAFDSSGNADFFGAGSQRPYATGDMRPSGGTETFAGSFAFNYSFDIGTKLGVLGTWHSGKNYDTYAGFNAELGAGNVPTVAYPADWVGNRQGDWAMDLGLRISHPIKFGKGMNFEPFLQISNLLNNYDYGNNYDGQVHTDETGSYNSEFGRRKAGWQNNQPRTAAVGFRFTF